MTAIQAILVSTALIVVTAPAHAVELSQRGNAAYLTGGIMDGDEFKLRDFLARPEASQLKVIYLHSPGGKVNPARIMARAIRAAGLATVVDGSKTFCNSACTGLFTAGVTRHYLNPPAEDRDGGANRGIGFHEGNSVGQQGKGYSGNATAGMINTYYEMGVPGATKVVTKAAFNKMHYISGATAMSLGIATSLQRP
jgi:hypothetical protein